MFYVICYDISDDKRRDTISKILESYGTRVQYSVFECNLSVDQLNELCQRLEAFVNADQDSIRIYSLCNACIENIRLIGGMPVTRESAFYIT